MPNEIQVQGNESENIIEVVNDNSKYYAEIAQNAAEEATEAKNDILNDPGFIAVSNDLTGQNTIGTAAENIDNITAVANVADALDDVINIKDDITTVSSINNDVTTVAGIASDVTTVAGISTDVTSVVSMATDITDVIALSDDISEVIDIKTDIATVAAIPDGDVAKVAAIDDDITTVATIDDDVTTVAGIASDVTTVAGIASDVTAVKNNATNINAVNSNKTNIDTVAGINSAVSTVAGISSAVSAVSSISSDVSTVAGIDDDVTDVASIKNKVTAVANNETNINTVSAYMGSVVTAANNTVNIDKVANAISHVEAVSTDLSNVDTVAGSISNVNKVGNEIANVDTVAGSISYVEAVGEDIANVNLTGGSINNVNVVGNNIANVNTVAGISSDVSTVSGISSDITAVKNNATNINAVNANKTNIDAVAGNSTNINTVAGMESNIQTCITNMTDINNAATNAATATTKAGEASASATLASKWANYMDGKVDGNEYSAKYYAEQAAQAASGVADVRVDNLSVVDSTTHIADISGTTFNALKGYTDNAEVITNDKLYSDVCNSIIDYSKFIIFGNPAFENGWATNFSNNTTNRIYVPGIELIPTTYIEFHVTVKYKARNTGQQIIHALDWEGNENIDIDHGNNAGDVIQRWGNDNHRVTASSLGGVSENDILDIIAKYAKTGLELKVRKNGGEWVTDTTTGKNYTFNDGTLAGWSLGGNGTGNYSSCLINMMNFKIVADDNVVFSSYNNEKTDKVDVENYYRYGEVHVSPDYIASNFGTPSNSAGCKKQIDTHYKIPAHTSIEVYVKFTTGADVTKNQYIIIDKSYYLYGQTLSLLIDGTQYFKVTLSNNTNGSSGHYLTITSDIQVSASTTYWCKIAGAYNTTTELYEYTLYYSLDGETYTATATGTTATAPTVGGTTIRLGCVLGQNYSCPFGGTIDLKEFRVYINGALDYEALSQMPYTMGSNGVKIVDSKYADRVAALYYQQGKANYFILDKINGTVILPRGNLYGFDTLYAIANDYHPDYSTGISIAASPYLISENGFLLVDSIDGSATVSINSYQVAEVSSTGTFTGGVYPIQRGDTVTFTGSPTLKFLKKRGV